MYKEEMDRLGFASGGWFKKLAALGSFFGTVADAAPAPPQTAYENLQTQYELHDGFVFPGSRARSGPFFFSLMTGPLGPIFFP